MTRTARNILDTALNTATDSTFHSNVFNRTATDTAAAAADRTLRMAHAMIPAIEAAYGADSIEAADARIARDRIEASILDSIFDAAA